MVMRALRGVVLKDGLAREGGSVIGTTWARLRNRYFLVGDQVLLPLAVYLSFVLRLDGFAPGEYRVSCLAMMALAPLLAPPIFYACGIYSRRWRYALAEEAPLLIAAVLVVVAAVTSAALLLTLLWPAGARPFPRSIPGLFFLLALVATAGPRLAVRLLAGRAPPACQRW